MWRVAWALTELVGSSGVGGSSGTMGTGAQVETCWGRRGGTDTLESALSVLVRSLGDGGVSSGIAGA